MASGVPDIVCCVVCGGWRHRSQTEQSGMLHPRSGQAVSGQLCREHLAAVPVESPSNKKESSNDGKR